MDKLSPNARLFIAALISAIIIFAWQALYIKPHVESQQQVQNQAVNQKPINVIAEKQEEVAVLSRDRVISTGLQDGTRVPVTTSKIKGSINLIGARIDDLVLLKYKTELDKNEDVILFSPSRTDDVYFAEFGWVAAEGSNLELPTTKTLWHADKKALDANQDIVLRWVNANKISFIVKISVDDNYLFHIEQRVMNASGKEISVNAYSLVSRNASTASNNTIVHEGPIGVNGSKLFEISYSDVLENDPKRLIKGTVAWLGFSDKYWLAALIPSSNVASADFSYSQVRKKDRFQASYLSKVENLLPGQEGAAENYLFAGAKELTILDHYATTKNIPLFDRAVDFGALYFITKPIFQLLSYFYEQIGNFGLAILLLTVVIKVLLFPLAHKGFKGMNRLKDLQPKMAELKEAHKDNPQEFQKHLLELYKKEKVNPMAGCLPILLQIPVFFALYKVLSVSIEMRQAPFFGWIHDLSTPDPTTIFNLFGLIPWDPPSLLHVGIFPLLMGGTMYIQQRLSPEPTDPTQAQVMRLMPLIFLFMFASFPSGLVIYWAWSNVLSIGQQVLIKKLETKRVRKTHTVLKG